MGRSNVLLIVILLNVRNLYCSHNDYDSISSRVSESNSYEEYGDSNEVYTIEQLKPYWLKKNKANEKQSNKKAHFVSKEKQEVARRGGDISNVNSGNINHDKYSYVVSIQRKGSHYATGALLHRRWILSAAGEFYNVRESIRLFKARLGTVNCKKGGKVEPVQMIRFHPKYEYGQPNYDLALLRLGTVIEQRMSITPIRVSIIHSKVTSAKFLTTYWPRLIVEGKVLPPRAKERKQPFSLRISTQKLIPHYNCDSIMANINITLRSSTLCLKPFVLYHSICMPDAGAPVVGDDGLWGITSGWTSQDCHTNPSPVVFTRVAMPLVQSWLNDVMKT